MPLGAKVSSAPDPAPQRWIAGATFKPVAFADLPGWEADDHAAAFGAFLKSCARIIAAARAGNKAGKVATPPELLVVCADAARIPGTVDRAAAKAFFEARFQPHAVVHKGSSGLLTGYYEPLLEGSRKADARFKTPIYKRPPDLVNLVEEAQRGAKGAVLTHARRTDKGNVPYATRAEIEGGALAGKSLELLYLADAVDVFFMQVQGSGRIQLPDGTKIRVHYDGKNGHPYTSIGRYLIDKGLLAADKLSLARFAEMAARRSASVPTQVMHQNASYVFFRELKGAEAENVLGVLEIPLTPGRSLAVDRGRARAGLAGLRLGAEAHACHAGQALPAPDDRAGCRLRHQGGGARRHLFRLGRCGGAAGRHHQASGHVLTSAAARCARWRPPATASRTRPASQTAMTSKGRGGGKSRTPRTSHLNKDDADLWSYTARSVEPLRRAKARDHGRRCPTIALRPDAAHATPSTPGSAKLNRRGARIASASPVRLHRRRIRPKTRRRWPARPAPRAQDRHRPARDRCPPRSARAAPERGPSPPCPLPARRAKRGLQHGARHHRQGQRTQTPTMVRSLPREEPGIIRRAVPLWLDEPGLRALVVSFTSAHPRHGGSGALYIHIRKRHGAKRAPSKVSSSRLSRGPMVPQVVTSIV